MSYSCHYCSRKDFTTIRERDDHESQIHRDRLGSGYFEQKKETPEGDVKALQHRVDALKAQTRETYSNTLTAPIQAPPRPELSPVQGWQRGTDDSFIFERKIGEHHTTLSIVTEIMTGKVTQNHFEMTRWRYEKDLTEIAQLQEKVTTLEARMAGLVVDDEKFTTVSTELRNARRQLREVSVNLRPERNCDTALEDYWYNDFGTEEHERWQKQCMENGIKETDRLSKNFRDDVTGTHNGQG